MKLTNILIAIGAFYFLTRKKTVKETETKETSLIDEKDRKPEVFDIEKKEIKTVSE